MVILITGSKYLSELVSLEMLKKGSLNIIKAPTGSGKSYFALTAIPEAIKGAYYRVVYLIDTVNGKEQLLENYNTESYSIWWKAFLKYGIVHCDEDRNIVVMTYAKFGQLLEENPAFHNCFDYIICDELPSLIKFQYFFERPNLHSIAREGLENAVRNGKTTVIALSATPNLIHRAFHAPLYDVPIDEKEVRRYETKDVINYTNLEYLLSALDPAETGICYVSRITQMKKLEETARGLGFRPISFWSIRNTDHPMNEEQLAVRQSILKDFTLPSEYNLLFINASSETSLKIKSPIDYVIVHNNDYDTQIQVRGRVNSDLSKLYLPLLGTTDLTVPDEYLNIRLFSKEKDELCAILNRTNPCNRLFKWPTIKNMLIDCEYTISEGRQNNLRYAMITPPQ